MAVKQHRTNAVTQSTEGPTVDLPGSALFQVPVDTTGLQSDRVSRMLSVYHSNHRDRADTEMVISCMLIEL